MPNKSETHETLFSFELMVEYVRIDKVVRCGGSLEPALGVRLLDFPTLLIYRTGPEQRTEESSSQSDWEKKNPSTARLLPLTQGNSFEYYFHKGKSCLFKINLDSLHTHLSNTPLYAMVLDVREDIPKLMGSSLISLARSTDQLKSDVAAHGICTPASYGERGVYDLCNLMGERIGVISLGYKLLSLGASLIPHIPESSVYKIGSTHVKREHHVKSSSDMEEDCCKAEIQPLHPDNHATHVLCQKVELDGQPTEIVVSVSKKCNAASTSTQTEHARKKVKTIEVAQTGDDDDDEQNPTIFCPPHLFYSSSGKNQEPYEVDEYRVVSMGMESLRMEDLYSEESAEIGPTYPLKVQTAAHISVDREEQQRQPSAPSLLGDALRQLPLLNALLVELSQLNGQAQQQPLSIHPNLTWLYTSAHAPSSDSAENIRSKTEARNGVTSPLAKAETSSSPRIRHGQRRHPHQEKSPPKRMLRYGLTNTFRLRLQRVTPGVSNRHECMEQREGMEQHKTKRTEPPKHTLTKPRMHKSNSRVFNRGANVDKDIETLVSSVDVDSSPMVTTSSKSQNKPTGSYNVGISIYSKKHLPKHDTALPNSSARKSLHTNQERVVQVHIPCALSQYSDHDDVEQTGSHTSHPEPKPTNPGFNSSSEDEKGTPGASRFDSPKRSPSSPPRRPSLSSSDGMETGEYQDDFTSLDPTDGYSPDPRSSPEPGRPRRSRISSDHSSSDGASYRGEALPVPVKAAASPQRALRSTHVIRPRPQISALSVSSDNSESGSVSSLSMRSAHRQRRPGSRSSGAKGPPVTRSLVRARSRLSDPAEDGPPVRGQSVDSFLPNNDSVPEPFSSPDPLEAEEEKDELGSLGFDKKYRHVSELVFNKLPGYTL